LAEPGTQWRGTLRLTAILEQAGPGDVLVKRSTALSVSGAPEEETMKNARLLSTVAATLLLTVGAASAQDTKKDEAPAPAPAAQQSAPAEKIAPSMKAGESKAVTHKAPETMGQAPKASDADKTRATTGQGAAAGSVKLSTEQRTKITTIIKQQKMEPAHLTVSVRVGTRLPESVHAYPLPVEVIVMYPEWRGYDYILVRDEIVIIDPRTHEIVAILEA
jgi:hypothetical protein